MSLENVSTGVLNKNKEHFLDVKIKQKYEMIYQDIKLHMPKYQ